MKIRAIVTIVILYYVYIIVIVIGKPVLHKAVEHLSKKTLFYDQTFRFEHLTSPPVDFCFLAF